MSRPPSGSRRQSSVSSAADSSLLERGVAPADATGSEAGLGRHRARRGPRACAGRRLVRDRDPDRGASAAEGPRSARRPTPPRRAAARGGHRRAGAPPAARRQSRAAAQRPAIAGPAEGIEPVCVDADRLHTRRRAGPPRPAITAETARTARDGAVPAGLTRRASEQAGDRDGRRRSAIEHPQPRLPGSGVRSSSAYAQRGSCRAIAAAASRARPSESRRCHSRRCADRDERGDRAARARPV